jgi:hypothetical protein
VSLDRSKPFKTVFGIADHAFEQDGKLFDHSGDELGAPKAPTKGKTPKPEPVADDQVSAQLEG